MLSCAGVLLSHQAQVAAWSLRQASRAFAGSLRPTRRSDCAQLLGGSSSSSSTALPGRPLWARGSRQASITACGAGAGAMQTGGGNDDVAVAAQQQATLTAPPSGAGAAAAANSDSAGGSRRCRIAVGQMTACGDQQANLATCTRLAQEAAAAGCRMLFLPECFSFIGMAQPESLAAAQPLDGPLMGQYQQLARSVGLWLSLGGFQEQGPDPQHIYNTHVVLDDGGVRVAAYRKVHLFDVDVPNGPVLMESRTTAPGQQGVVVDTPAGRLGLTVCYDLRFPEMYQRLTWEGGAQLLSVPSAFTKITGAAHWEVLLRARAIECQAYVVAAAQAGRHNAKRESWGQALVIDPWGTVVAQLDDREATGIAVADVDLGLLEGVRAKMPIQQHRAKGLPAYSGGVTVAGAGGP